MKPGKRPKRSPKPARDGSTDRKEAQPQAGGSPSGTVDHVVVSRQLANSGIAAAEKLFELAGLCATLKKQFTHPPYEEKWRRMERDIDDSFGIMMRTVGVVAQVRAVHCESTELIIWAISNALNGMRELPKLLERYERILDEEQRRMEFEAGDVETFSGQLALAVIEVVKYLESECERRPVRFRGVARELPHWPALVTQHRAGYRKKFDRIAGESFLSLGSECPVDTSPRAMYRLQTPVCGLLWEEIFRDWINVSAEVRAKRRLKGASMATGDVEGEKKCVDDAVRLSAETDHEGAIFRRAFALPELRKGTAAEWANQFVIPYLHLKFPDWRQVPALAKFVGKQGGDTKAEKEIRRAVVAMARP